MSKSKGRKLAEWLRNLDANSRASSDAIKAGSITTAKLDDGAVTTAKLDNLGVTFGKLHTALVVTESDGIGSNDNDSTVATSAAIIDYVSANSGGIALTDLSVGTPNSASGSGAISYNNSTGEFKYTPPDLSSYSTFSGSYNDLTNKPTIPTNNNQLTNGAGYITSFDITTQTDSKYLRSDTDDTTSGVLTTDQVRWGTGAGTYSGNPRSVVLGYSGGNYGQLGYGWVPTGTSGVHTSALSDVQTRIDLKDGIQVFSSNNTTVTSGNNVSWTDVLDCRSSVFQYKNNNIWHAGNDGSGSGLDADTVDGIEGSNLLTLSGSQTVTGAKTLSGSNSFTNSYNEFGNGTGSVSNDGGWHGRVNVAGTSHARLDVKANGDGIITTIYSHDGHGVGKVGTMSNHPLSLMSNGGVLATFSTANVANNIDIRVGTTGSAGIVLKDSGGTFKSQWYGTGTDNGFLTGEWGAWDLRKTINGQLLLRVSGTDYTTMHNGNIGSTAFTQTGTRTMNGYYVGGADGHRHKGIYGNYNSYRINNIWSMGTSYVIDSNGGSFGNLYGMAYTYSNRVYTSNVMANGHQMVWCQNGTPVSALGSGVWTAGNVTAYSDIRVKENLERIPDALEKVKKLNGYTFDRTDIETDNEGNTPRKRQTGVVAQEVLEVLPEVVTGNEENPDGHLSVAYGNMVGLLIEAIKEQQEQIEELKARLQ